MPARLTFRSADLPPRSVSLDEGRDCIVGREATCDVPIDDERVSRRHARLRGDDDAWSVHDLGSKNGTTVNGIPATPQARLDDGSWVSFGGVVGRFDLVSAERAHRSAAEELSRWRTSAALQRELDPALGVGELVRRLLDSVLQLTGAERGFVLLAGDDGSLAVAHTAGLTAAELAGEEFAGSLGAVERTIERGTPLLVADALADDELAARDSVLAGNLRTVVCLPLTALERRLGILYADGTRLGRTLTGLDSDILLALAGHAALAIAVAHLGAELRELRRAVTQPVAAAAAMAAAPAAPAAPASPATWDAVLAAHRQRAR